MTEIISLIVTILVTTKAKAKHEFLFKKLATTEQKFVWIANGCSTSVESLSHYTVFEGSIPASAAAGRKWQGLSCTSIPSKNLPEYLFEVSAHPGKSYWRGRLSTVDLLVLTSLDQLLLYWKLWFTFFTKQASLLRRSIVLILPPQLVFLGVPIIRPLAL